MSYPLKCSNEELLSEYKRTGSVWKTAKRFEMCGQSVWERLRKLGATMPMRVLTPSEKSEIESLYRRGFLRGDGNLNALAERINRTVPFISRYAGSVGLANKARTPVEYLTTNRVEASRDAIRKAQANGTYKNSMKGKHHTKEAKKKLSEASLEKWKTVTPELSRRRTEKIMRTRFARYGTRAPFGVGRGKWKSGWREIGGKRIFFRSRWEANYARYLEFLKQQGQLVKWEHEPQRFWFEAIRQGVRSYLPDFRVTWNELEVEYHEVKGWMDSRSKTTINRMRIYHPSIILVVIDGKRYAGIAKKMNGIIKGWE